MEEIVIASFLQGAGTSPEAPHATPAGTGFDEAGFFRDRFGIEPSCLARTDLPKGHGSLSLVQFASPDGPVAVRKSIAASRTTEIALMTGLARIGPLLQRGFLDRWPLPEVYHVEPGPEVSDVYMQVVPGIAFRHRRDLPNLVQPLAGAIHDLARFLPVLCQAADVTPTDRSRPGSSFFSNAERLLGAKVERLRDIARYQRLLPHSICHNDVLWPNMGITPQAEITFIDFGMLGRNVVGADLHHFARLSVKSDHDAVFFRDLAGHFAEVARMDLRIVEMNALVYAAMRLMAFEKDTGHQAGSEQVHDLLIEAIARWEAFAHG